MFTRPICFGLVSGVVDTVALQGAIAELGLRAADLAEIETLADRCWQDWQTEFDLFEQYDCVLLPDRQSIAPVLSSLYPNATFLFSKAFDAEESETLKILRQSGADCKRLETDAEQVLGVIATGRSKEPSPRCDGQPVPKGPFCFVVPLVHPDASHVSDYQVATDILRLSLTSYLAQDISVHVVVLCHRVPPWAADFQGQVTFVNLGDHPTFRDSRTDVRIDKGLKHMIGAHYALQSLSARAVMFADADDFAHRTLASTAVRQLQNSTDGLIVRRGYHALMARNDAHVTLKAVLEVDKFQLTCGTCRIYRADALHDRLQRWHNGLFCSDTNFVQGTSDNEICLRAEFLDTLWTHAAPLAHNPAGLILTLGSHQGRSPVFDLSPLDVPLVAKGCGHGNHHGPRKGDVHWHRTTALASRRKFLRDFGLAQQGFHLSLTDPRIVANALANKLITRLSGA